MGRSGQFPRDFCPRRHSCPAALCPHKATTRTFACHSSIPWADHHSAKGPSASSPRLCSFVVAWASARVAVIVQDTRPPWEGEAPADPKSTVRVPLSFFAHTRSPGIPARPPPTRTNPQHRARFPFTHPYRALITTQQKLPSASSPRRCSFVVAWASARVVPSVREVEAPA